MKRFFALELSILILFGAITLVSCTSKSESLDIYHYSSSEEISPKDFAINLNKGLLFIGDTIDITGYKTITNNDDTLVLSNLANTYKLYVAKQHSLYKIYQIEITGSNITTYRGAFVGISTRSLKKLYPELNSNGQDYVYSGNTCNIYFYMQNDLVSSIVIKYGKI